MITGANGGVGRELAYALAQKGVHLGLISRNVDKLIKLKNELRPYPITVEIFSADLSKVNEI